MSSAPRPQTAPSRSSPLHGSTCHSAGSASTVSVWQRSSSRGPVAAAGDPRDEVRALGDPRVELAVRRRSPPGSPRSSSAARRLVARRVDGVEPDQLLEQVDDLVAETLISGASRATSRYPPARGSRRRRGRSLEVARPARRATPRAVRLERVVERLRRPDADETGAPRAPRPRPTNGRHVPLELELEGVAEQLAYVLLAAPVLAVVRRPARRRARTAHHLEVADPGPPGASEPEPPPGRHDAGELARRSPMVGREDHAAGGGDDVERRVVVRQPLHVADVEVGSPGPRSGPVPAPLDQRRRESPRR